MPFADQQAAEGDRESAVAAYEQLLDKIMAASPNIWRHWEHKLPGNSFVLRQLAATDDG